LTPDQPQAIESNQQVPVILEGVGKIVPEDGQSLFLGEVVISEGAAITAEGLAVSKQITMSGKSSLGAVEGGSIQLFNATVIEFQAASQVLPSLNLGLIGEVYNIVPQTLKVDPPRGLGVVEVEGFSHPVVSGTTLSNCEAWRAKLELSSASFTSECVTETGGRLLAGEKISLVIKGRPAPTSSPTASSSETDGSTGGLSGGLSGGAIAGIVVGAVVVVGVAAVGVFLVIRKKGDGGSGGENP
jgi:hypothetical protein